MKKIVVGVIIAATAFAVQADVIANWDNDGLVGNELSAAADTLIANVDTATISRNRITGTTYTDAFAMRSFDDASLAAAITAGTYMSVSLSASAGNQFTTLTELFVRIEANNIANGRSIALFSDATGFTDGDELYSIDLYDGGAGPGQFSTHTIDLSGVAALQGVTDVEFRIYNWGSSSVYNALAIGRGYQTNGSDDLTISGTVSVVPEPATVGMLGLGALVAMLVRRLRG